MVKLQLVLHIFFNNLNLTSSDIDCATTLALNTYDNKFFKLIVDKKIFKSVQTARNCMSKLKNNGIVIKEDDIWKINPKLSIGISDIICLQLKAKNNPE